jgi:hypothetical protein
MTTASPSAEIRITSTPSVAITHETIAEALAALWAGRSTGSDALDRVRDALARSWERARASVRSDIPQLPDELVERIAKERFEGVTSSPAVVAALVMADAVRCAEGDRR